jgi:hypothetical protein
MASMQGLLQLWYQFVLNPWHLLAFAVAGFFLFGAMGNFGDSGQNSNPRGGR